MKYIKLIFIISVIAGLFYGIFRIIGPDIDTPTISPDSPTLLDDLKKEVDNDWKNAKEWDQDVYDRNISDAKAYHKDLERAAAGSYTALIAYTNEKVCNKLIEFLNNEFKLSNCSQSKISKMKSNIDYFVKNNGSISESDSRISNAYSKIKLYDAIISFGRESFKLSPNFNLNSGEWESFDDYKNRILKKKDNFKKDDNYSALSHITDIKTSLNSAERKLEDARKRFMQKLSDEIIDAYSSEPRTITNLNRLNDVYNKYYNDGYDDGGKLSKFKSNFFNVDSANSSMR